MENENPAVFLPHRCKPDALLSLEANLQEASPSQYSPFILVSNLRAHLYVALEKNAWLQKRIEELEEERNFLRCQLDRLIVGVRGLEGERGGFSHLRAQVTTKRSSPVFWDLLNCAAVGQDLSNCDVTFG